MSYSAANGVSMKASRYNSFVDLSSADGILIFNSLSGALGRLDVETARALAQGLVPSQPADTLEHLAAGGFILPADVDEQHYAETNLISACFRATVSQAVIAPTMACNLRCGYCFQYASHDGVSMDRETVAWTQRFLKGLASSSMRLDVLWYGGEPLLAWDRIREILHEVRPWCESRQKLVSSRLITNGYLMSNAIVDEMVELGFQAVQVTLDGTSAVHDNRRGLKNGGGTFERIIDNLAYAVHRVRVNIRVNIDQANAHNLPDLHEFLISHG